MKKVLYSFTLIIAFAALFSCTPDPTIEMHEEVMRIHDEVMPLTADLNQAIVDLQAMTNDSSQAKRDIIYKLRQADKAMFEWMGRFEEPDPAQALEERVAYYEKELDKIKSVANGMTGSLETAQKYMDEK